MPDQVPWRLSDQVFRKRLPDDFSLATIFEKFADRAGCLWLDSASNPNNGLGRHSFLCSDPIDTLIANPDEPDPWPTLSRWCEHLPTTLDSDLPPFQGGIAGLIGYEAATWLESTGTPPPSQIETPAISLGVYPWTIATDHERQISWIIARDESSIDFVDSIMKFTVAPSCNSQHCSGNVQPGLQYDTHLNGLFSNFESDSFRLAVADIVKRIRRGDSFQVNLAQRLSSIAHAPSPELYRRLRAANPAPFAAYFNGGDFQVLSSSPEGFLQLRHRHVQSRPIKGTIQRSGDGKSDERLAKELLASEKDRAENIMIVDLMRNDLSRVCDDESIRVTQLCQLETYQFVQHLVSVVEGDLSPQHNAVSLLKACFPGGSVTGAPKIEAMRTICQLEPQRRGPYCGSIGYISTPDDADFNILIRTMTAAGGHLQIPVGGGITAQSNPESEESETWIKAEGMLRAISKSVSQDFS